jgi:SAM-dependent methyltransferase
VSGFAADWLALREPADLAARDAGVLEAVVARLDRCARPTITDLACGTGSTLRALAPRLAGAQTWRLVDHDEALLERAARAGASVGTDPPPTVETLRADLATDVEAVVALEADLVATSAFLDLVSDDWLARWVDAAGRHRRAVYAALSYDGRVDCAPRDPLDTEVLAAFDAHQRRDKGLGGALGPAAAGVAVRRLREAGFSVTVAHADWRLGAADAALQRRLVAGWHEAVAQTGAVAAGALDAWLVRRLAAIDAGASSIVVGHVDLFALPPAGASSRSHSMSPSSA